MSTAIQAAPVSSRAADPRGLLRWVCTSNPFYALSAALFLVGLWASFGGHDQAVQAWGLMSGLGGYTLLLAVTACLLVRFGNVWDDIRTVLLLVVLMFLATSVTFDEILVADAALGTACNVIGFLFAVAVSEGVLRGIRLRLPAAFRLPYYLALALFFLYPLLIRPFTDDPHGEPLAWLLFGFPAAAGVVCLSLIPAARRGPDYLSDNGSPWRWPLYPWVLFGLLGLAVPARAFLLCYSMQLLGGGDIGRVLFGPYFLVPFGFAVTALLLEIGLQGRRVGVLLVAMAAPVGLAALAALGHRDDAVYRAFLDAFTARLGGEPLLLTILLSILFYAYAAARRVPLAGEAAAVAMLAAASLALPGVVAFHLALLLVAALGAARHGWMRAATAWLALAACALAFVAAPEAPAWAKAAYPLALGVLLFVYGLALRHRLCVAVAGAIVAAWLAGGASLGYASLRQVVPGLDAICLSLALFGVAVLVSLAKSGLLSRWVGHPAILEALARPAPAAEPSPHVQASSALVRDDGVV